MRTKAAPGDDQLPVEVFKQCFPVVSQFLQRLFTASIQLGFFSLSMEDSQGPYPQKTWQEIILCG